MSLLFGASGCGKTSLLRAGVMPRLRADGFQPVYVSTEADALGSLRRATHQITGKSSTGTVADILASLAEHYESAVIIFDQFEQHLITVAPGFGESLLAALSSVSTPVSVVISVREDFLAECLDVVSTRSAITSVHLRGVRRDDAARAIEAIAATGNVTFTAPLIERVTADLADQSDLVDPANLQIVCHGLCPVVPREPATLDTAAYVAFGGAAHILTEYVDRTLDDFTPFDRDAARQILQSMTTARGTRVTVTTDEIAAACPAVNVTALLNRLIDARLVRSREDGLEARFELTHDHVATRVLAWRNAAEYDAAEIRDVLRSARIDFVRSGWLLPPERLRRIELSRANDRLRLSEDDINLLLRSVVASGEETRPWLEYALAQYRDAATRVALELGSAGNHRESARMIRHFDLVPEPGKPVLTRLVTDRREHPHLRDAAIVAYARLPTVDPEQLTYLLDDPQLSIASFARKTLRARDGTELPPPRDMIHIPASEFMIGSRVAPWEEPMHRVPLAAFFMDRTAVTNAAYQIFVAATDRAAPALWMNGLPPEGKLDHPVVYVTWFDALAYAEWSGKRLPTEYEWEAAARGPNSRVYPWGDEFDSGRANTRSAVGDTTPAGAYPGGASPEGILDLAGNVWEWVRDAYRPYPGSTFQSAYFGDHNRVRRGGSFLNLPEAARGAARGSDAPASLGHNIGFRCAWSAA